MECSAPSMAELAELALFEGVHLGEIQEQLEDCCCKQLEAEEILLSPGTSWGEVYIVLEGSLRIHLKTPDDIPVSVIEAGEGVGELSLFVGAPRSAFVVADERCRLLEVPRDIFWDLLRVSHTLTLNYLKMLSQRLRQNNHVVLESRNLQQMYRRHALTDSLTGLHNRRWFDEVFPRLFQRCEHSKQPLCVVMIDIDHFKKFNDEHGHQAGDFTLFIVAQVLKGRFRPTDLVARYGGEEFIVVMPNTDRQEAMEAAERARVAVAETHLELPEGVRYPPVTVSLGVAIWSEGHSPVTLVRKADDALYRAKDGGRNRVSD